MREVLLVQVGASVAAALRARGPSDTSIAEVASAAGAIEVLRDGTREVAATVVGPETKNPIQLAQRAHALHPTGAVVILSDPARLADVRRALLFAPFIGDQTVCHAPANADELIAEVAKVVDVFARRKRLQAVVQSVPGRIAAATPRAAAPATYLGTLLEVAPIGIVALDPDQRVTAMNPFATKLFGAVEREALGAPLTQFFAAEDEGRVRQALAAPDGKTGTVFRGTRGAPASAVEVTVARAEQRDARAGFLVVAQDVTERVGLVERLESAIRVRDDFLSVASHELKTPIAALKLNVYQLVRKLNDDHAAAPAARRVDHSIARVTRLMEDLLDVARLASGVLAVEMLTVDFAATVRDALTTVDGIAHEAGCQLRLSGVEQLALECDERRVEQVITNLLTNAIKFGRGKPIDIEVTTVDDAALLTIRDRGIGIAAADQTRIFQQFERAVGHRAYAGWGLGLWISRRIIESHGGTISVASAPEEGATFAVRLPLTQRAPTK